MPSHRGKTCPAATSSITGNSLSQAVTSSYLNLAASIFIAHISDEYESSQTQAPTSNSLTQTVTSGTCVCRGACFGKAGGHSKLQSNESSGAGVACVVSDGEATALRKGNSRNTPIVKF